jgi:hypothetical protein
MVMHSLRPCVHICCGEKTWLQLVLAGQIKESVDIAGDQWCMCRGMPDPPLRSSRSLHVTGLPGSGCHFQFLLFLWAFFQPPEVGNWSTDIYRSTGKIHKIKQPFIDAQLIVCASVLGDTLINITTTQLVEEIIKIQVEAYKLFYALPRFLNSEISPFEPHTPV